MQRRRGAASVVRPPPRGQAPFADFILRVASAGDGAPAWSTNPIDRDAYLRSFLPTESIVASAFYSTCAKYAAFGWRLTGPPRTTKIIHRLLHSVDEGDGWLPFIMKVLQDLFGQDNGAFIEVIRADNDSASPVVMLNHLDSARCKRTGIREEPVWYKDRNGKEHILRWYQVIALSEFPSPQESAFGVQICALSRILRAAQLARDISNYKKEKISGKHVGAIHLVGGVSAKSVRDAMKNHYTQSIAEGYQTYFEPLVVASLDPNATVSKATLEMASLPDGFNEEIAFRNFMITFANAFGTDLQDYMPLPGGNLGTSQQSAILDMKSKGKGPRLFMGLIEHKFNWHGIMPDTVAFGYGEQDVAEDEAKEKLRNMRAERLAKLVEAGKTTKTTVSAGAAGPDGKPGERTSTSEETPGIITPEIARQMMNDEGDLKDEYLALLGEENQLDTITLSSSSVPL